MPRNGWVGSFPPSISSRIPTDGDFGYISPPHIDPPDLACRSKSFVVPISAQDRTNDPPGGSKKDTVDAGTPPGMNFVTSVVTPSSTSGDVTSEQVSPRRSLYLAFLGPAHTLPPSLEPPRPPSTISWPPGICGQTLQDIRPNQDNTAVKTFLPPRQRHRQHPHDREPSFAKRQQKYVYNKNNNNNNNESRVLQRPVPTSPPPPTTATINTLIPPQSISSQQHTHEATALTISPARTLSASFSSWNPSSVPMMISIFVLPCAEHHTHAD